MSGEIDRVAKDAEEMEEQKTEKEIEVINKETEKLQDRIKKLKEGKTEEIQTWTVQEVSTQTTPVIYNSKTKKPYDLLSAIVELLNRTEE